MEDFERIYRECGTVVYRYLLSLTRDCHLAEELTQETMFRAIMNIDAFRGECRIATWLCRIAQNLYYDHQKKAQRALPLETDSIQRDPDGDVAQKVEDRDTASRILEQLHGLEEPYKEVFMLHALGDVPLKRISQLFGKSESWARVTYYRAKTMIAVRIKEGDS